MAKKIPGRNGGTLTPFQKGQSGNPAGRPPGIPNAKERLQKWLNQQVKTQNPITEDEEMLSVIEAMDLRQIAKALKGDIKAYQELNDRLEGRSVQTNNNNNEGEIVINVKREDRGT